MLNSYYIQSEETRLPNASLNLQDTLFSLITTSSPPLNFLADGILNFEAASRDFKHQIGIFGNVHLKTENIFCHIWEKQSEPIILPFFKS